MSSSQGQWMESPSGSGAEAPWTDNEEWNNFENPSDASADWADVSFLTEGTDNEDCSALSAQGVYGTSELRAGEQMNTKIPPAWNGRGSWFAYEELVLDWVDITNLEAKKQGPALKNRLQDEAAVYKTMLDRPKLSDEKDGVTYFLNEMRPHFV